MPVSVECVKECEHVCVCEHESPGARVCVCAYYRLFIIYLCSLEPGSSTHRWPTRPLALGTGDDAPLLCQPHPSGLPQSFLGAVQSLKMEVRCPGPSADVSPCRLLTSHSKFPAPGCTQPHPPLRSPGGSWFARMFMKHEREGFFFF